VSYTINAEVSLFDFSPFLGKTYTPTQLRYPNGELKSIIEADDTLTFSFSNDSDEFSGYSGCNYFQGPIETFTSVKFEGGPDEYNTITTALCVSDIDNGNSLRMEQQEAFLSSIWGGPRLYESDDENFVLYDIMVDGNGNELKGDMVAKFVILTFCTSEDDCVAAAADMGVTDVIVGDFPTKGCFKKNDRVFFSGSDYVRDMSTTDLPGIQERVYCGIDDVNASTTTSTSPTSPATDVATDILSPEDCAPNLPCSAELATCTDGSTESCCNKTYESFICDCETSFDTGQLQWSCYYTDMCLIPDCDVDDSTTTIPTSPTTDVASTESSVEEFPQLLGHTWTVLQYFDGKELVEPVPGGCAFDGFDFVSCWDATSITLTLGDNNINGRVQPGNTYFGEYKDVTSSSILIDGTCCGQTTLGVISRDVTNMEMNYLASLGGWDGTVDETGSISIPNPTIDWKILNDGSLELRNGATKGVIALYKRVCLTKEDCTTAANSLGIDVVYDVNHPRTKGCFTKNGKAFWSDTPIDDSNSWIEDGNITRSQDIPELESAMAEVELPGVQERIFCGDTPSSSSLGSSPSELSLLKSNENGLNIEHVEQASSSSRTMISMSIVGMIALFLSKV